MTLSFDRISYLYALTALAGAALSTPAQAQFPISRQVADGTLDVSFHNDGRRAFDVGDCADDDAVEVAHHTGSRVLVLVRCGDDDARVVRFTSSGDLDTAFGSGGVTTVPAVEPTAMAVDGSGRILVVGRFNDSFAAARLTSLGVLDTTFGSVRHTPIVGHTSAQAESVAVQVDGKVVVAGDALHPSNGSVGVVVRYNTNGTLDTSFSNDGVATVRLTTFLEDRIKDVAIGPNNRAVICGTGFSTPGATQVICARLTSSGVLDTDFSIDGRFNFQYALERDSFAWSVAVDLNNRVYTGGWVTTAVDDQFAVARITASGALDTSFSGDGKVITNFTHSAWEFVHDIELTNDTKLVAVGAAQINGRFQLASARWLQDGSLDTTYSNDGKQLIDWPELNGANGFGVDIDLNGRILSVGND